MIFGSLLLIFAAIAMAVLGILEASNALLVGSIGASLFAAVVLIIGARQAALAVAGAASDVGQPIPVGPVAPSVPADRVIPAPARTPASRVGTVYGRDAAVGPTAATGTLVEPGPAAHPSVDPASATSPPSTDEDPPDEPAAQVVSAADAAQVARLTGEVLVIDGRPRYHTKAGCVVLLGRESEPLPVSEAVELGFSPCGICEPDSVLLAEARRV